MRWPAKNQRVKRRPQRRPPAKNPQARVNQQNKARCGQRRAGPHRVGGGVGRLRVVRSRRPHWFGNRHNDLPADGSWCVDTAHRARRVGGRAYVGLPAASTKPHAHHWRFGGLIIAAMLGLLQIMAGNPEAWSDRMQAGGVIGFVIGGPLAAGFTELPGHSAICCC